MSLDKQDFVACVRRAKVCPMAFTKYILDMPYEFSPNQKCVLMDFYGFPFPCPFNEECWRCNITPVSLYDELVLVMGRKSAKTEMSADATLFEVYKLLQIKEPRKYYRLAKKNIYAMNVATNRDQAIDVTFDAILTLAESSWYLEECIVDVREKGGELEFYKNIIALAHSSSARGGRGYQCIVIIFDEIGHYIDTKTGNQSGTMVYNALKPNVKPFKWRGDGKVINISSPAGRQGILWENYWYVMQDQIIGALENEAGK
ncbi:MAG: hypothetical protein HWN68_02205 [Desulfobacterales bacterium]|nr:hypothetical protein [Desulfobacterales bacterium]